MSEHDYDIPGPILGKVQKQRESRGAKDNWRTLSCPNCGGHGIKEGFECIDECNDCGGSGQLWIRPTGHLFLYPGGPAMGMWSKEAYIKATPINNQKESNEE